MNRTLTTLCALGGGALLAGQVARGAEAPPQVYQAPAPGTNSTPAPPPSAPAKKTAAELEKLVAPIALYPDPLIATILPASVYPLEIVQAARFLKETNNLARVEAQPWDENVKAVGQVPAVLQKMNEDLDWTVALGEAFLAQDKEVMNAIQTLREKAQKAGTLQSTAQQAVVVTNMVVEKTIEQQVVVVTNTVVQIQPANPQVIYVPQYDPMVVYAPPPTYVYNPVAPLVTFGVGVAVGVAIANNCDWHGGGVYVGHHGVAVWGGGSHGDVDVDVNRNINQNINVNQPRPTPTGASSAQSKWQPDQNRVRTSGAPSTYASAGTAEARGWSSGATQPKTASTGTRPAAQTTSGTRPTAAAAPSRPAPAPSTAQPRASPAASRPPAGDSAFSGVSSGTSARNASSRGAASRSGSFAGGGRGGGRR